MGEPTGEPRHGDGRDERRHQADRVGERDSDQDRPVLSGLVVVRDRIADGGAGKDPHRHHSQNGDGYDRGCREPDRTAHRARSLTAGQHVRAHALPPGPGQASGSTDTRQTGICAAGTRNEWLPVGTVHDRLRIYEQFRSEGVLSGICSVIPKRSAGRLRPRYPKIVAMIPERSAGPVQPPSRKTEWRPAL